MADQSAGLVILGCFLFAPNGHKRSCNLEFREKSYSPSECPIADTTLSANMNSPTVGTGYFHLPDTVNLAIEQVLDGDGVLVAVGPSRIFVRTDREYVDGSMLSFGLYVSIGTVKYTSVNGTPRTIWAFEEVDRDLAKTRYENAVKAKIEEELKRKKIAAQQEFERKQAQMKADEIAANARIELERQATQQKIELEKLKQQQEQKEMEERIKRKPIEQKQWAEYASNKLSAVSLKLGKYVGLQKDLNRYVFSVSVTEKSWAALVETQARKDWLGFLSVVANEKLIEYPEPKTVDMYVERLFGATFHAERIRGQVKTDEKLTKQFKLDLDISSSDEFSNDGAFYSDGGAKGNEGSVCPSCNGKRYVVKKIECNKCGGTGKIITPAKKLIVGYSKERSSTCKDCYGTGFKKQRVKCADCNNGME